MSNFLDFTEALQKGNTRTEDTIGKCWLNADHTYQYFLDIKTDRLFIRRFDAMFGQHGAWIEKFTC